jgi:hypothetical protein
MNSPSPVEAREMEALTARSCVQYDDNMTSIGPLELNPQFLHQFRLRHIETRHPYSRRSLCYTIAYGYIFRPTHDRRLRRSSSLLWVPFLETSRIHQAIHFTRVVLHCSQAAHPTAASWRSTNELKSQTPGS